MDSIDAVFAAAGNGTSVGLNVGSGKTLSVAGTAVISGTLTAAAGSAAAPTIAATGDTNTGIFFPAADTIAFTEGGAEAMRIDSSGNVGIGTTTPSYRVDAVGAGSPANGIMRTSSNLTNSTTKYGYYTVGHYTNATVPFGFIQGESNNTENNVHIGGGAGEITAATRIDFYTASNNTTTNGTERMRIDSSGHVLVGTTSSDGTAVGVRLFGTNQVQASKSGDWSFRMGRRDSTGIIAEIYYNSSRVGDIATNGTGTSYNSASDYRLKENVEPMTGALAKVAELKPVTYKWKIDGSDGQGFIAHELAEVVPDAVRGEKDEIDADGNPVYQSIDTSFLVATLTAAIQEQQALITSLTARIAALEA
jgi:hypothetical protein